MKLTHIALTAGAIAMIGAIGMDGTDHKLPINSAMTHRTGDFQKNYEKLINNALPIPAPKPQSFFSPIRQAQAQVQPSALRNLNENAQTAAKPDTGVGTGSPNQPAPITTLKKLAVDESALRYFAQQGDLKRLQAEISRLRSLYPNWTPPANPLAVEDGEDDQLNAMWQAYAQGNYTSVDQMIQARRIEEPDWTPPADLVDRLHLAETRTALLKAAETNDYDQVIDLASKAPSLLTCSEINILWQLGEAFAKTDKLERAMDDYSYILKNCDVPQERLATMQKALGFMPYNDMKTLLGYERTKDAGAPEFTEIRDALLRDHIANAGEDKTIIVTPDDLAHMETLANDSKNSEDAQRLAWYFQIRGGDAAAEKWFRKARTEDDTATISQGLALILIEQDKADEAESIMYQWRDTSNQAMDTYLNAVVNMLGRIPRVDYPDEVLKRMAEVITKTKSMNAAHNFGWYSNDYGQPLAGLQWFEAALSWEPWDEPSAYGVTLMLNTMRYKPGVFQMQKIWAPYSERIAWLHDPNAPVTTLDKLKATIFELTGVKAASGTTRIVAVPVAEIDLATGEQTPLGASIASSSASTGPTSTGVSLTAPLSAPGTSVISDPNAGQAPVNYVPEYYQHYYGENNAGFQGGSSAGGTQGSSLSSAFERINIPRSMIKTDPITGVQTVTVLNSDLRLDAAKYVPSAAQVKAAFYTYGQPSDKTVIYRFDQQSYTNRDYLRQFEISYFLNQTGAVDTNNQIAISTLPVGTALPAGTTISTTSITTTPNTRRKYPPAKAPTTRRTASTSSSSGGSSSAGSCWSGRSSKGLSPNSALRQGWCLMDLKRPMEAAESFETALGSSSSKTREEAAYGQSLAYMQLGLTNKAAVSASQEPLSRDRQLDLQIQILTNRALAAYKGGHYNDALLLLNQRSQIAPDETGLMIIRGYAYFNLNRFNEAHKVFNALTEMGNRKGMEGLALTRHALGLPGY